MRSSLGALEGLFSRHQQSTHLKEDNVIDVGTLKISPPMIEVANGLNVASGCMHYLYNHTTGGSKLTGALLSMTLLYNLYDAENRVFTCKQQTSV